VPHPGLSVWSIPSRGNLGPAPLPASSIGTPRLNAFGPVDIMEAERPTTLSSAEIRRVLRATDIEEVVSRYTQLDPTSTTSVFRGYCPLRADDSPLFFVLRSSQTFHCLGCDAAGDALHFLRLIERTDQYSAVRKLQHLLETSNRVKGESHADPVLARTLIEVHSDAARFFAEQLRQTPAALAYLSARGVGEESMTHWMFGYAPDAWDGTLGALDRYPAETLVAAGLAVARDGGGFYDRFRGRLMFPIRDVTSSIVGFGGRILGGGEPKYLNSRESPLFHKGSQLYGQYESSQVDESIDRLWVVEGYMDVVALWQHGIRNCVATLGTSTTTEHVQKLQTATDNVLYCFDGDRAGRAAAWRALQSSLPVLRQCHRIQFLLLPEREDPDSLVRKIGAEAFQDLGAQAVPLAEFVGRQLASTFDIDTIDGRARLLAKARALIARVTDPISRYEISVAVAERARVSPEMVEELARLELSNMDDPAPLRRISARTPTRKPAA
jgi:DNA primase